MSKELVRDMQARIDKQQQAIKDIWSDFELFSTFAKEVVALVEAKGITVEIVPDDAQGLRQLMLEVPFTRLLTRRVVLDVANIAIASEDEILEMLNTLRDGLVTGLITHTKYLEKTTLRMTEPESAAKYENYLIEFYFYCLVETVGEVEKELT